MGGQVDGLDAVYGWVPVPGWNKVRLPDGIGANISIMRTHLLAPALLFPILGYTMY